jgi:alpha-tubulin suppressor-like RCC1 family protein
LGDGTTTQRTSPVDVVGLSNAATAITAGYGHTCALTDTGGAKCWGQNTNGQLGDGSTAQRISPVDVVGLTSGVGAIAVGYYHTCALTSGGGVRCWGRNTNGQLGDGTTIQRTHPVDVVGLSSGMSAITAGNGHTCALTSGGGVKCWGDNSKGQLGDGTNTQRTSPVDVSGLSSGVVAIGAGYYHTCALTNTGGIKCWGDNTFGQLGDGTNTPHTSPVDVSGLSSGAGAIGVGYYHTCALTSGGGAKCWGNNIFGSLGDGSTTQRTSPVDVVGLSSGVSAITAGYAHTCALTSGGGVKCWGLNTNGQLGDGSLTQRTSPVDVVGLTSGVSGITTRFLHTCASTSSGGTKCWGDNSKGQLGDGSTSTRTSPVAVNGLSSGVLAVDVGYYHTCALTGTGGVKCWGDNTNGQLGNGFAVTEMTPVDSLFGIDFTPTTNPNLVSVTPSQIQSGVWQRDISGLSFTWSGATGLTGFGISGYFVYWGTDANGTGMLQASSSFSPTVPNSGTYYLRVQTLDAGGNVTDSYATLFTLKYDTAIPGMPTDGIEGHSVQNRVWQNNVSQPSFSWTAGTDSGGSGVAGYNVYWGTDPTGTAPTTFQPGPSYTPQQVVASPAIYYLRAQTKDGAGNLASGFTTLFTFKYETSTPTTPPGPATESHGITSGSPTDQDSPSFGWTAGTDPESGIGGFFMYWGNDPSGTTSSPSAFQTGNTFTPATLSSPGTYYLRIQTVDAAPNASGAAWTGNQSSWQTLFVYPFGTNSPPTDITLSRNTIPANPAPSTVIGSFTTQDPDAQDTFTYLLVLGIGSEDNSRFEFRGSDLLTAPNKSSGRNRPTRSG